MADEKERFLGAGAVNARDHVALAVIRSEHQDVARGKAGIEQAFCHGVSGNRGAADGIGGIDFNELLEDVARKLLGAVVQLSVRRTGTEKACDYSKYDQNPRFQFVLSQE